MAGYVNYDELERTCKEAVMVYLRYNPDICLEILIKTTHKN
jgi:hypothetical protein